MSKRIKSFEASVLNVSFDPDFASQFHDLFPKSLPKLASRVSDSQAAVLESPLAVGEFGSLTWWHGGLIR